MDPVTLAVAAATLISKFFEGSVSEAGKEAGAGLVAWVKDRFKGHEDREHALARVQDAPDSPARVKVLEGVIADEARSDPDFLNQLARLLEKAQPVNSQGSAMTHGNQSPAVGQISGSTTFNYGVTPPPA